MTLIFFVNNILSTSIARFLRTFKTFFIAFVGNVTCVGVLHWEFKENNHAYKSSHLLLLLPTVLGSNPHGFVIMHLG